MSRALVIGGTLFMGRALVEQLLARGDDVTIMHRGEGTPFGERVHEFRCDRNDAAAVQQALAGGKYDVVYDNVYDWQRRTTEQPVAAAARAVSENARRYVFTSSVAVYPEGTDGDEDSPLVPADHRNPYARDKAESERALFRLQEDGGPAVTTLRPAFIYGAHNPFERESFFWDRILAGRPVIIPEDGGSTMQWVYSQDVARAAIAAADADVASGRAYNLAEHPPVTQVEFVETLARVAGREAQLVFIPRARLKDAGGSSFGPPLYFGAYLDIPPITVRSDRVRDELGVTLTPLEDGLRETFRWYRTQDRPAPDYAWEDGVIAGAR